MKSALKQIFLTLGLFGLAGCSLFSEDEPRSFEWVQPGSRMVFDFHPVADTLTGPGGVVYGDAEGAFVITLESGAEDAVVFRESFPLWAGDGGNGLVLPRMRLRDLVVSRAEDGLRRAVPLTCGGISLPFPLLEFVRVPTNPEAGDELPQYRCQDSVETMLRVEQVDHSVEVPAGTFATFVLAGDVGREYWSEREGLVRIELLEEDGDVLGYYELASKNF